MSVHPPRRIRAGLSRADSTEGAFSHQIQRNRPLRPNPLVSLSRRLCNPWAETSGGSAGRRNLTKGSARISLLCHVEPGQKALGAPRRDPALQGILPDRLPRRNPGPSAPARPHFSCRCSETTHGEALGTCKSKEKPVNPGRNAQIQADPWKPHPSKAGQAELCWS